MRYEMMRRLQKKMTHLLVFVRGPESSARALTYCGDVYLSATTPDRYVCIVDAELLGSFVDRFRMFRFRDVRLERSLPVEEILPSPQRGQMLDALEYAGLRCEPIDVVYFTASADRAIAEEVAAYGQVFIDRHDGRSELHAFVDAMRLDDVLDLLGRHRAGGFARYTNLRLIVDLEYYAS